MKAKKIHVAISALNLGVLIALLLIYSGLQSSPASAAQARELRVVGGAVVAGQTANIPVELIAQGNENALGFSLNFNPAIFSNPLVSLGSGAGGATLNSNTLQSASGRIGVAMALPSGQSFPAGTRQVILLTFTVAANAAVGPTSISFGDQPIVREISDANAAVLTATFTPGTITIQQQNPVPALTGLNPTAATAGSGAITLTVNGSNFVNSSEVRWNNSPRATSFVTANQLSATIPASDLTTAGTASVTVVNPAPGGGTSNALSISINNPVPAISSLNPTVATAGGAAFNLIVTGSGFVNGSTVQWNGAARATTFLSATQLMAAISAADIASAGTAAVTVINAAPGGGASNSATFTINQAQNPVPAITSLSPNSATAGDAAFILTVNGANFISGSTVQWNGSGRTTTFVSGTQLTAAIPSADLMAAGAASVTVVNPAPGGGTSNAVSFTINPAQNPVPTVVSLSPNSATAGDGGFTLAVSGTNFINGSIVQWNGAARTTTFAGATQLMAAIPASDIATAGSAAVTVVNPAPGGGASNAVNFTINPATPAPTIASLSPSFAIAAGDAFVLTVNGVNFTNNSTVQWNGGARMTTFVSATQLMAEIPAPDIVSAGTATITVVTPAPGGGTSNALSFNIVPRVTSVSAASFLGNELATESIAAGFGVNLATSVVINDTLPLPTSLAGTIVKVKDSVGVERLAPLFFVAPTQVNYLIPPGTANGVATVTVTSGDNTISMGTQQIATVAPGLFTANASGGGVPAATILRIKTNGDLSYETLSTYDSVQGRFVPTPIDLGPEGDQVFALLFGTGFRFNGSLMNVGVKIGGTDCEVSYAGEAPGFVGLDQSNVRIPRSLIGRGEVDLVMTVNGKPANTVRVNIK